MGRYTKGTRVIDRSGQPPKGTVISCSVSRGRHVSRSVCKVKWDDGKIYIWPTKYLKKV